MKISIISDKPLQKYHLQSLDYKTYDFPLDKEFELATGWYELKIAYVDTKIEIQDIKINDSSLREFLYTGYYTNGSGKIHQPACAVWDEGGVFTIWVHTETGILFERLMESIKNRDYGKNLFEKYVLTVDRPLKVKDVWSEPIKSFFRNAHGPQWWDKHDNKTPWMKCDIMDVDKDILLTELKTLCQFKFLRSNGRQCWNLKPSAEADLPFVELDDIQSDVVREFIKSIGYKRVIDIEVATLDPGCFIDIHRDDHYNREAYPYMKGCKKFYWTCSGADDVHYKLGRSGCLPHHQPLFINTLEHPHAVIHEGSRPRTSILIYGDLE